MTRTRKTPAATVTPLDYTPSVGCVRHLTLTLPKSQSQYSGFGGGLLDTTVTLSADEADELAEKLRSAAAELRARA